MSKWEWTLDGRINHPRHKVRRGKTEDELKNITPVKDLLQFGQDADVIVSPPESAKSGTKVHVDSSYQELIERAKADIEEAMDMKFKKQVEAHHC